VLRYADRLEICVDLAGVDRDDVHLTIEDHWLRIYGTREALDAKCCDSSRCRVLMMEIDDGPFERLLPLPADLAIDLEQVTARQENGLLWICVPIRS
jgi:HSP20 family molecular chaperone IbpA